MSEYASDEVVRRLRESESLVVALIEEDVLAGRGVGDVVVDVAAAARAVGERLGHVRGDGAVPYGELAGHHLEEGIAVGGCQRITVDEVELVLAVGVLVVGLVRVPPEPRHSVHHIAEVALYVGDSFEVVAGLGERVDVVGVEYANRAVGVARHEEVLRLDARVENVALFTGVVEDALEVDAGIIWVRLVVDVEIGGEPGNALGPGANAV